MRGQIQTCQPLRAGALSLELDVFMPKHQPVPGIHDSGVGLLVATRGVWLVTGDVLLR